MIRSVVLVATLAISFAACGVLVQKIATCDAWEVTKETDEMTDEVCFVISRKSDYPIDSNVIRHIHHPVLHFSFKMHFNSSDLAKRAQAIKAAKEGKLASKVKMYITIDPDGFRRNKTNVGLRLGDDADVIDAYWLVTSSRRAAILPDEDDSNVAAYLASGIVRKGISKITLRYETSLGEVFTPVFSTASFDTAIKRMKEEAFKFLPKVTEAEQVELDRALAEKLSADEAKKAATEKEIANRIGKPINKLAGVHFFKKPTKEQALGKTISFPKKFICFLTYTPILSKDGSLLLGLRSRATFKTREEASRAANAVVAAFENNAGITFRNNHYTSQKLEVLVVVRECSKSERVYSKDVVRTSFDLILTVKNREDGDHIVK